MFLSIYKIFYSKNQIHGVVVIGDKNGKLDNSLLNLLRNGLVWILMLKILHQFIFIRHIQHMAINREMR